MRIQDFSGGVFSRSIIFVLLASVPFSHAWAQDLDHRQRPTDDGRPSIGQPPAGTKDRVVKPASTTPKFLTALNSALEGLAAKASQGVVQILVTGYGPIEDGGRTDAALIARQKAIGSGVVVDPSGYVVTNAHVVEGAQRIRVVLPVPAAESAVLEPEGKRRILDAKLVGMHQESDLALLKVNAKDLPILPLGTGRGVHQGQLVLAIGSPEGLQGTVTMGVVSSVARQPDPNKAMVYIQTDAPINPGNSGGAGLNLKRSWGVLISDVTPDGPAEAAGLTIGDIVLAADDRVVDTLPAFTGALYLHPVDRVLKLDILRDSEKKTLFIPVLQERQRMDQLLDLADSENNLVPQLAVLAVSVDDKIRPLLGELRISSGVAVLGRAADLFGPDIGLTTGDVIHAVNGRPVDSVENLRSALSQFKSGDSLALQIEHQGKLRFVSFEKD